MGSVFGGLAAGPPPQPAPENEAPSAEAAPSEREKRALDLLERLSEEIREARLSAEQELSRERQALQQEREALQQARDFFREELRAERLALQQERAEFSELRRAWKHCREDDPSRSSTPVRTVKLERGTSCDRTPVDAGQEAKRRRRDDIPQDDSSRSSRASAGSAQDFRGHNPVQVEQATASCDRTPFAAGQEPPAKKARSEAETDGKKVRRQPFADLPQAEQQRNDAALLEAAEAANVHAVAKLLEFCNPNTRNTSRWTALHYAAKTGNKEIAERLLEANADANAVRTDGRTPLHTAATYGHVNVAEALLAVPEIDLDLAETANGLTVFHAAALHGHLDLIKLLHRARANIEAVTKDNRTPFLRACSSWPAKIDCSVLHYLVHEARCDVRAVGKDNMSGLHYAIQTGRRDVVEFLLGEGFDVNAKDAKGSTPLFWAVQHNHQQMAEILIKAGTCLEIKDNDGKTALDYANKQLQLLLRGAAAASAAA